MALFYLVRHGEANYDYMLENGFWGFGRDFAPLSEKGRQQAEIIECTYQKGQAECKYSFT